MRIAKRINDKWSEYDKTVAETHLRNYGVIFLDTKYRLPIDDLFELEELYTAYMAKKTKA